MPKILIAFNEAKDRKAATSSINLKKLIEERLAKNPDDKVWTVVTLSAKMKLANVCELMNGSLKKLTKHEGKISVETYTIDPAKERGKWSIEAKKEKRDEGFNYLREHSGNH